MVACSRADPTQHVRIVNYNVAKLTSENCTPGAMLAIFEALIADDKPGFAVAPHVYVFQEVPEGDVPVLEMLLNDTGVIYALGTYTIAESNSQGLTDLTGTTTIFVSAGLNTVSWVNQQPVVGLPGVDIELATNGSDADLPADAVEVEVDSTVSWTMVVTNTGNIPLTNVTVTGPDAGNDAALIIEGIDLAPGETATFERVGVADEGLVGKVADVATNEGVSDSDPSHYTAMSEPDEVIPVADVVFTVDIELATNGVDADLESQAVTIPAGGAVEWTYVVTNTGPERLTEIVVVDNNGTPDDPTDDFIVASGFHLDPGDAVTFSTEGGAPLSGLFGNSAAVDTAEGATDVDPSHYTSVAAPAAFPNTGSGGLADRSSGMLPLASAAVASLASVALLTWLRRRAMSEA